MVTAFLEYGRKQSPYTRRVTDALIRLVLSSGLNSSLSVYVLSCLMAFMVRRVVRWELLWGWLAVMTVILVARLTVTYCFREEAERDNLAASGCVSGYLLLVVLTSLMWGVAVWFFFPDNAVQEQTVLIFMVAGLTAAVIAILAPFKHLYYLYIAIPILSLAWRLISLGGTMHSLMGGVVFFYLMVLAGSAARMHDALVSALEMGFANDELLNHLRQAKEGTEALNRELLAENQRRQQTEEALLLSRDAAQAGSRAKDEFLANMSHEIRTPMNGILGTLQLLRESGLNTSQAEYARLGYSSAEALLAILNDILDFSKIEAGKLALERIPMDLRRLVDDLVHLLEQLAGEKGISLAAEVDERLPPLLLGDPTRMRQVLANLMTNAIKFTEQGEVRVRLHCLAVDAGSVMVRIEVCDTGIGIAPEARQRLFQVFSQADGSTTRKYGGTGLGLAIVRQLVVLMGGGIGVESEAGRGSTFWCELSFAVAEAVAQQAQLLQETVKQGDLSGRILLVEDNKVNQLVAKKMLVGMGITVTVAENGAQALSALEQADYDLVLMDCQMPVLDGYEATRKLREREQGSEARLPVIAMTANAMEGDRQKCLDAGMDDHLAKPVRHEALRAMLSQWLNKEMGV